MPEIIEVSHVSKRGSSLRITIPQKVALFLDLEQENLIGFNRERDSIIISKLK